MPVLLVLLVVALVALGALGLAGRQAGPTPLYLIWSRSITGAVV